MSNSRNNVDPETLNGCDMMDALWAAARQCHLEKPGLTGVPSRAASFINCNNIYDFMRVSALKCWQEKTPHGANPSGMFAPINLTDKPDVTMQQGSVKQPKSSSAPAPK